MHRHSLFTGPLLAWICFGVLVGRALCGVPELSSSAQAAADPESLAGIELSVPSNRQWSCTGIELTAGDAVTLRARGRIVVGRNGPHLRRHLMAVGPQGTFLFDDNAAEHAFPLPAAQQGPAPAFCLMGRIGNGPPFYVGRGTSWIPDRTGTLYLGVNDFDVTDNLGQFYVQATRTERVHPIAYERTIPPDTAHGVPAAGCSVVIFYIDGLRPDVVREMAAMGHIPHINRLFVEGGVCLANTFTAFPSDTITSNGTMWTGCFSDRHGVKGQVRFSRRTLHSESYLETLGPQRSSQVLTRQGLDKALFKTQAASIGLLEGKRESRRWQSARMTEVPPIYQHLRWNGSDWATGVLPMMTDVPPLLWTRSMVRHLPYFRAQDAWMYIDDANADYAQWNLLDRNSPVTIIWLPETDSVSHKQGRGQFGMTRRTIARADELIGDVVDELKSQGRFHKTYLMLVSDHGHHGGRDRHLSHFDLAGELFHRPRGLSPEGEWVAGGLGLSVRQHRYWNRHRGDNSREFVFIDGDSDGAARVFLPRRHFRSAKWTGPHRPGDLLAYRIASDLPPVNLVKALTSASAVHGDGSVEHPVDLVLMKLTHSSILIATEDRGEAVIHRKRDDRDGWLYKYFPVQDIQPATDGRILFTKAEYPQVDPLRLLEHLYPQQLTYYHNERDWLRLTAGSEYPDGVVALTRHMLWQENLRDREQEYAPDIVVTARSGWYFGTRASPGTMHGYPLPDAMHATLFIAGPNVYRGARIDEPCRLADLTPTLLDMVGIPSETGFFDGVALRNIYRPAGRGADVAVQPVYWQDVDLHAWKPLKYRPLKQYEHMPVTINKPTSAFDLNNITYNLLAIADLSLWRLIDDVLFPLADNDSGLQAVIQKTDRRVRNGNLAPAAGAARVVDLSGVTIGDYSFTSLGNLKRADRAVDLVQRSSQNVDKRLARPLGRADLPGSRLLHSSVDGVQSAFWEVYRCAQQVIVKLVDETLLNSIEDGTDRTINQFRRQPAEVIVHEHPATQSDVANRTAAAKEDVRK